MLGNNKFLKTFYVKQLYATQRLLPLDFSSYNRTIEKVTKYPSCCFFFKLFKKKTKYLYLIKEIKRLLFHPKKCAQFKQLYTNNSLAGNQSKKLSLNQGIT